MRPIRCAHGALFACALCLGTQRSHDPYHNPDMHPPTPGEQAGPLITVAMAGAGGSTSTVVKPGTGELVWTGFAPTLTISRARRMAEPY